VIDFSALDILINLLLAARWTVVLSLAALVNGGLLGLALLFLRLTKVKGLGRLVAGYVAIKAHRFSCNFSSRTSA
jgi:polar amino acid transport system permease protein